MTALPPEPAEPPLVVPAAASPLEPPLPPAVLPAAVLPAVGAAPALVEPPVVAVPALVVALPDVPFDVPPVAGLGRALPLSEQPASSAPQHAK
jgi:hypothetical protein